MANCARALSDVNRLEMQSCSYIQTETLLEGTAEERAHVFLTSADEKFIAGVWECTPCKERIDSYPADEFMTVLAGSVTVTDDAGRSQTFSAGDSFTMQKGWSGTWHMTELFRKYFVMYLS